MRASIFVVRGGMFGWDGLATSPGMDILAGALAKEPNTTVSTWNWSSEPALTRAINVVPPLNKVILIGYSGGGWKAGVAALKARNGVHLLIGMDPSPYWDVNPLWFPSSVSKVICYWNGSPNFGSLGGGVYHGEHVSLRRIDMHHMRVQFNIALRAHVVQDVRLSLM